MSNPHDSSDADSELELPSAKRIKKREESAGVLEHFDGKHPLFPNEKMVTFSSNRRKKQKSVEKPRSTVGFTSMSKLTKLTLDETTKDPSTVSQNKPEAIPSSSNKEIEIKEESELRDMDEFVEEQHNDNFPNFKGEFEQITEEDIETEDPISNLSS